MSLRHALLNLLAEKPLSGYDLAAHFSESMGNVWPAQHSQIYPELGKLLGEGLIAQTGEGPRGRKVYETTEEGLEALRTWLRQTSPDYSVRDEPLLRVFCMWALPREEALEQLRRDRAEYLRRLDAMQLAIGVIDWAETPAHRCGRLAIECGVRHYRSRVEWVDWAMEQIAAGTLEPGAPVPS